jgi:hypothetical protein
MIVDPMLRTALKGNQTGHRVEEKWTHYRPGTADMGLHLSKPEALSL